jgi:pectate lyase
LELSQDRAVTATFVQSSSETKNLSVTVEGSGSVSSDPAGIDCGQDCQHDFTSGTQVALTATPEAGYELESWGGACSGSASTCRLELSEDRVVTATFAESGNEDPCEGVSCSGHGSCEDGTCNCDVGYAGDDCSDCADGYVPSGDDCTAESGSNLLSWTYPTARADGSPLGTLSITGAKVYRKSAGAYVLYNTVDADTTRLSVPEGQYAVAATWSDSDVTGQSALSDSVDSRHWKFSLDAPNASNTFTATDGMDAVETYLATLDGSGGVVYLSDADGDFDIDADSIGLLIDESGTPSNYITVMAVPGESPKITGAFNPTSEERGADQDLVSISGDYIRLYGLTVHNSGDYGISINSNYPHVEACEVYDCYRAGIHYYVTSSASKQGGLFKYNKCYRCRAGSGIALGWSGEMNTPHDKTLDNVQFVRNIGWRNGYLADNTKTSLGASGNNADGMGATKAFNYIYTSATNPLDGDTLGRWNSAQTILFAQNIALWNSDDGFDESLGEGTTFIGNISVHNGPEGNRGFKVFCEDVGHLEEVNYVGNVAIMQNPNGGTSKTTVGYELQTNIANSNYPQPTKDIVNNTGVHHDNFLGGTAANFRIFESAATGLLYNNLSFGATESNKGGTWSELTNFWDAETSDPDITDTAYDTVSETFTGSTIEEQWRNKYREIMSNIMPQIDGNLYASGTYTSKHMHETSMDDATTPSDPDDYGKFAVYKRDKTTLAPDIGACQYQDIYPPVASISNTPSTDNIMGELVGHGASVTGGKDGTVVTVTTLNDTGPGSLRQAVADASGPTWIVFSPGLTGTISMGSVLDINSSNLTIDGRGADITLSGYPIIVDNAVDNIILMYFKHAGTLSSGGDCISFDQNSGVGDWWCHHLTLQDADDELIGITNDVTDWTISYCKLVNTDTDDTGSNGILAGGSDGASVNMYGTIHHCWFNCTQRQPRTRRVRLHYYNNYQEGWSSDNPGVSIGENGQCYYENNCANANATGTIAIDWKSGDPNPGDITSVGTHYLQNGAAVTERNAASVFTPDYTYTADTADATLVTSIQHNAGWQNAAHPGATEPWNN